ncbi:MAG: glycosyltransferase family 4 protein [Verrucomicrobiota bacterium]|nr:glycosyltransferase family 4 protein [Verrucomicrobiota bacterium]
MWNYDGGKLPFKVIYLPYVNIRFFRSLFQPFFLFWYLLFYSIKTRPDVIYENCVAYSFSGGLVSRILRIKHCMHVHGFYPDEMAMAGHGKLRIAIIKFFEWMDYHLTDTLFCVTPVNKEKIEELYNIKQGIAHFVYNGVDADRCRPMSKQDVAEKLGYDLNTLYIGFTGYLFPWSGVDQLIRVAPSVIEQYPNARFLIVGNGIWGEKELPIMAKKAGMEDYFIFAGYQPWEKVPLFSNLYDIGVTPYPAERGVGRFRSSMKSLEYSATATPVVITQCEGVSDIIENGKCGIVVPPDNDKALADALIKLLKDRELREKLGQKGRVLVENGYTWRHVAENMLAIIN